MLRTLTRAQYAGIYVAGMLLLSYAAVPAIVGMITGVDVFNDLIRVAIVSGLCVLIGSSLPVLDWLHSAYLPRIRVPALSVLALVWVSFAAFVVTAWITAPSIPLVAAVTGADAQTIATAREMFLKARTGWQHSFVYINALFAGAVVPYTLGVLFLWRARYRWLCFAFFFLYSISFVEKAFFFKAAIPLTYLALQGKIELAKQARTLVLGIVAVLLAVTALSAGSDQPTTPAEGAFFSTSFIPSGAVNKIIWRTFAIPVVTASDGIRLFNEDFGARPLGGATSSLVAAVLGIKRVEFERLTFASQFGQNETGTGSANSVFFVEALVNFGWSGVVVISLLVGLILRAFAKTRDEALRALWILFAIGVYTSGLIGTLLSNGFALVIPVALLAYWSSPEDATAVAPTPASVLA